jgi:hypothetical protein
LPPLLLRCEWTSDWKIVTGGPDRDEFGWEYRWGKQGQRRRGGGAGGGGSIYHLNFPIFGRTVLIGRHVETSFDVHGDVPSFEHHTLDMMQRFRSTKTGAAFTFAGNIQRDVQLRRFCRTAL